MKPPNVSGEESRKKMNDIMLNSEVELGKFLGSLDVIPDAYQAIKETSSTYQLHTTLSGMQVLAFHTFPDYLIKFHSGEFDLVSSEDHEVLQFISTKVNPKFSINKAAVELFEHLFVNLSSLPNQLIETPMVVTGQGLGGYLAILYTLLHQHAVDLKESSGSKSAKRPICITFGAPLLGDENLGRAISERARWNSCFVNMVAKTDPLASFFSSSSPYKPFGTFLFCTESGGHTAFKDQDSVLAVLDAMASSKSGDSQMHDYGNEIGSIRNKKLYHETSDVGEFSSNLLRAGIEFQLKEVSVFDDVSDDIIEKMEGTQAKMIRRTMNSYEPTAKLNEMKISLTYIEWYMKSHRSKGGYYDGYKNAENKQELESRQVVIKHKRILNRYWKKTVEENNMMPQKESLKMRTRWLYSGTNYRRIIEPLDIADHYKGGKTNYMTDRPYHYVLLEKWLEDEMKVKRPSDEKTKPAILTEDSCFWAHVEEALISLRDLKNGGPSNTVDNLEVFEEYVLRATKDFSLSPDVFLEGSSLRKWWSEYKGSSYDSEFARYMNEERYKAYVANEERHRSYDVTGVKFRQIKGTKYVQ